MALGPDTRYTTGAPGWGRVATADAAPYGVRYTSTGNRPVAAGRRTVARSTTPSRIGTATFESMTA